MKEVCIPKRLFEKILGYGIAISVTVVLVVFLYYAYEELQITEISKTRSSITGKSYCNKSLITNDVTCYSIPMQLDKVVLFSIFLSLDFSTIGYFIYRKQQKIKFKFCVKQSNESVSEAKKDG